MIGNNTELLRGLRNRAVAFATGFRTLHLRVLGLRIRKGVVVGRGISWPLINLRQITLEDSVSLGPRGWFYIPTDNRVARITIGHGSAIGAEFVISANNSIHIGNNCLLSYRVSVLDHDHITGRGINPVTSGVTKGEPIEIGANTFVGCGTVILSGTSLGKNCIVGANSVVTRSFEDFSVLAGAPAQLLKRI
jgi:acetyltransferase-like isoleucine patch superfamily enzyme